MADVRVEVSGPDDLLAKVKFELRGAHRMLTRLEVRLCSVTAHSKLADRPPKFICCACSMEK